ncbi:MAG: hypothetical protein WDZ53_07535 [Balneolales bacterium]
MYRRENQNRPIISEEYLEARAGVQGSGSSQDEKGTLLRAYFNINTVDILPD